jgi:SPP1 family predicted phage head-tail adaptor
MRTREVSGRMDERVTLSTPTDADDGEGGRTSAHVEFATVPASIDSLRGEERFAAAASETTVTHKVLIRWHQDVTEKTRMTWGTRVLEVVGPPAVLKRRKLLECYCAERVQ